MPSTYMSEPDWRISLGMGKSFVGMCRRLNELVAGEIFTTKI